MHDVTSSHNELSPWWQIVRDCCSRTPHISAALMAALACRAVALDTSKVAMVSFLQVIHMKVLTL